MIDDFVASTSATKDDILFFFQNQNTCYVITYNIYTKTLIEHYSTLNSTLIPSKCTTRILIELNWHFFLFYFLISNYYVNCCFIIDTTLFLLSISYHWEKLIQSIKTGYRDQYIEYSNHLLDYFNQHFYCFK